jgi:non-specific serine/threonine protein kinase
MHEAIAWSYNLLPPTQQRWFRALSIFIGGYQLSAAESICWGENPITSDEGLSTIAALVDASLVQVETTGDGLPRYRLLEVIREYAAEQLRTAGEEEYYQRRHAEYYAALAEEAERIGSGQGSREAHLERESANGRAALYCAYERGEVTLGLQLATWFGFFWTTRGQMSEANLWLSRMLALDEARGAQAAPPAVRSRALYYASRLIMHLGRRDRALALAEEALALAERTGDQADISYVLALLGSIVLATGSEDEAAAYFTESYAAAKRAKDAGDTRHFSHALLNLGELARKRGDVARATEFLEEALADVRAIDMTWGIANILTLLGHVARQQQDYERAKVRYRESLALYQRLGNVTYTAWCLEGIAAVACAEGSYQHATRLCAAAAALRVAAQTPLPPTEQDDFEKVVMTARAELDERTFTEQWRIGSTMTQDEAIAYALMGPLA